jgi:uncharacterized protein YndB with AHSA1/START domain
MSVIVKEIHVKAEREVVWRYLEDPSLLAGWLMRNDFRPERGRTFHFWATSHTDWDGTVSCELVDFDPPHRIAFTWNANNVGTDTLVSIELSEQDGGTLVRLCHANWEGAVGDVSTLIEGHTEGWSDHLWVLSKQVEAELSDRQPPAVDWTQFHLFVAIDAVPDRLFHAWATARGMESFFVEMMHIGDPSGKLRAPDEPAAAGDPYLWRWNSGASVAGEYLAADPGAEVGFTFGEAKVRVLFHPHLGGTLLELHQYDMEDTPENRMHLHTNCRAAWVYFLTVLKTLMEHGVDGRDTTRATGGAFSTYFDPRDVGLQR